MLSRVMLAAAAALSLAAACRGGAKNGTASCQVVEREVREVGGALEVSVAVRWTAAGKNYRNNKPLEIGRFDPKEQSKAALEERYKPGTAVPCVIDPAHPTRVRLR
jgi:hypothetical protein